MREFNRMTKIDLLMLTDQEMRFCERYVEHFHKARAVRESGSKTKYVHQQARTYLAKKEIKEYIEILKEDASGRVDLRLDRVLKEQMRLGFSNMAHFVEKDKKTGHFKLKAIESLGEDDLAAISEIIITDTKSGSQKTRLKLHPKQPALDSLLKYVVTPRSSDGEPKKGDTKDGKGQIRGNVIINQILADPKTRRALELLTNQVFVVDGKTGVPAMPKVMLDTIEQLTAARLVEYQPVVEAKGAHVDPEDPEYEEGELEERE